MVGDNAEEESKSDISIVYHASEAGWELSMSEDFCSDCELRNFEV